MFALADFRFLENGGFSEISLLCVTLYVIDVVLTLIDHNSGPMSAREISQLL